MYSYIYILVYTFIIIYSNISYCYLNSNIPIDFSLYLVSLLPSLLFADIYVGIEQVRFFRTTM